MRLRLLILVVVAAALTAAPALAAGSHTTRVAAKLSEQVTDLKTRAHPAILLPTRTTAAVYPAKRLFGSGGRIPGGYDLELGKGRSCTGQHLCQQGTFVAQRGEKLGHKGTKVTLRGDVPGRYLGRVCGASCSVPRLVFKRAGVLYDIEWAVPEGRRPKHVLVALANASLRAGPR